MRTIVVVAAVLGLYCLVQCPVSAYASEQHLIGIDAGTSATPGVCAFTYLVGKDAACLTTLHRFRDEVLAQTAAGRIIIEQYYTHDDQLLELLQKHPALCGPARRIVNVCVPVCALFLK